MGVYIAEVQPRWSDMDSYGHVNHANTVTLLEEARVALLFTEGARHGAEGMARGVVVAKLVVDYLMPIIADGNPVRVSVSVTEMRHAAFTLDSRVLSGPVEEMAAVTAQTLMVPYDPASGRPRRLTEGERDFLAAYRSGGNGA